MNKWQKEVAESLLDSEEDVLAELEKQYQASLRDITKKIKAFQADIDLLDEALNQDGLSDAERTRLLSQKRSKIYQKQYQEALQSQVGAILDKMQADQYTAIDGYLKECYEDAYVGTLYDLSQQGMPVITPVNQAAAVQAILTDSKISGGLYNALGVSVSGLKKTITQEISRGIASGLFWRDIARNINNASGSGYSNARRIVVTEGNRIQNTASRNAALDAKAHGADLVKVWDATLDGKTRESHRMVDGEIRELDEKFSNGLDRPGDPAGSAAEVVNCRCKEIHKPRWDANGGFAKVDNFTGEVMTFNSPKDYATFKEQYWSDENIAYMRQVSAMEEKYGTQDFGKLLGSMTDDEYARLSDLEIKNPLFKLSIEKPGKSVIMNPTEMFKKRIDSRSDFTPVSEKRFNELTIEARKKGAVIIRGTEEVENHLREMGAFASTIGDTLMFREDATIGDVLEETHHFMQNISGLNDDKEEPLRTYLNEIEAKKFIIENAAKYGVPRIEVDLARDELAIYERLLDEFNGE